MRSARPALSRLLALATLALPAAADVLILEDPGAGLFTDLQAAVDAASDGATLVLGPEDLGGCVIDGKGLTLLGPAGGGARLMGTLWVRNLGPQQALRLSHLTLQAVNDVSLDPALDLRDCQGPVRLSACTLLGVLGTEGDPDNLGNGGPALVVQRCDSVAVLGSLLRGGNGGSSDSDYEGYGGDGAAGLALFDSSAALYGCQIFGGAGGIAGLTGGDGGSACGTVETWLFAAGCQFMGGRGGDALDFLFPQGGDGGDGLLALGQPRPRLMDSTFAAGAGGQTIGGANGQPGTPRSWDQGSLSVLPGPARLLRAQAPAVQAGGLLELELQGAAGDRFHVAAAPLDGFGRRFLPAGVLLLPKPVILPTAPQLVLSQDGTQLLTLTAPPTLAGQPATTWVLQAWVRDAQGGAALAGACLVTSLAPTATGGDCDGNGQGDTLDVLLGATDVDGDLVPDACGSPFDYFVDPSAPAGGVGSLGDPFGSLAEAFAAVPSGVTLHLQDGTYAGSLNRSLDPLGRELTLRALGGPDTCQVELGGQGAFVESDQASSQALTLEGLHLRDGARADGGAVYLPAQPLRLVGCRITDCVAASNGGALVTAPGSWLQDSTLSGNRADGSFPGQGGGAVLALGQLSVLRCTFDFNQARSGGALLLPPAPCQGTTVLSHCVFRFNGASVRGGALDATGCDGGLVAELEVNDSFFSQNSAPLGGALYLEANGSGERVDARLSQCTVVQNSASPQLGVGLGGGAIAALGHANAYLNNTILWDNQAGDGPQVRLQGSGPASNEDALLLSSYSIVQGGPAAVFQQNATVSWLNGSQDADPLFAGPPQDYRLGAGSPALDAGNVFGVAFDHLDVDGDGNTTERVSLDLLGQPRQVDDPAPDTGSGSAPLPDLGAFERQP